jgi:HlyD family secretion protein
MEKLNFRGLLHTPKWKWLMAGLFVFILLAIASSLRDLSQPSASNPATTADGSPRPSSSRSPQVAIAALGRVEPQGGIISLTAPTSLEAVKIEKLLVDVGDRVKQGQVVAILDGRDRQQAALAEAQSQVRIAEAKLAQVKAGSEAGDISAQRAEVVRLDSELRNAQAEYQRYEALYQQGAISTSLLDGKRLTYETVLAQRDRARASLESVEQIRPEDIQVAQAELENAKAKVAQAKADLGLAYVRAPITGEVLAVRSRLGGAPDAESGIAELGQTSQMEVVAEIDQADITKIQLGQRATVTSGILEGELHGKVNRIGSMIGKNDILDTDPAADEDTRVVEVRILLDPVDSQRVAKLTNLEVDVTIDLPASS